MYVTILKFWRRRSVLIIGWGLITLGAFGIWRCPDRSGQKFSEAFLIAGFLSVSVDSWLKRKLQEDAAKDIFQHLLGITLPDKLRAKMQKFVEENAIYRKDVAITAHAEETGDGVILTITAETTVVAASNTTYRQSVYFEKSLDGHVLEASLRSRTRNIYALRQAQVITVPVPDEPLVVRWQGEELPVTQGEELYTFIRFTVKRSRHDFYVMFFGTSVIEPRVRVSASEHLRIFASGENPTLKPGEDEWVQVNGDEYVYHKVFLKGDHIQIRWEPRVRSQ